MNRNELLEHIYAHILECPEDAPNVMKACEAGIHEAFSRAAQRAADMESALAQSLAPKLPKKVKEKNIREWLTKWRYKCNLRWDWYLDT
jgi:hypothetical protein